MLARGWLFKSARPDHRSAETADTSARADSGFHPKAIPRLPALLLTLALAACDPAAGPRCLLVGDSILGTSAQAITEEGLRRGHVVLPSWHGGMAITETEGACPQIPSACASQTQSYLLPRIASLEAAGVEWDSVAISLGTNDGLTGPDLDDLLAIDAAFGQSAIWLLPIHAKGAPARALLEAVIPPQRLIDLEYELGADQLHPSVLGAQQIAAATLDACEASQ